MYCFCKVSVFYYFLLNFYCRHQFQKLSAVEQILWFENRFKFINSMFLWGVLVLGFFGGVVCLFFVFFWYSTEYLSCCDDAFETLQASSLIKLHNWFFEFCNATIPNNCNEHDMQPAFKTEWQAQSLPEHSLFWCFSIDLNAFPLFNSGIIVHKQES